MAYDKEKMSRFENTILSEAKEKVEKLKKETEEYKQTELERAKQMEYDRIFGVMQSKVRALQWKYRQIVTKASLDARHKTLVVRNELAQKVFEETEKALLDFSSGSSYKEYLLEQIKKASENFDCSGATLYLRSEDMKFEKEIQKLISVSEIQPDKLNLLGGFRIVNEKLGLLLDETFKSKLNDQHEYFYRHCGLAITDEKG